MMGEFVHGDVGDEIIKGHVAARRVFIEDGQPVKPDRVGAMWLVGKGFFGQRDTIVETGQIERVALHLGQNIGRGLIDHLDHHIAREIREGCGESGHGIAGHGKHMGGGGHGADMDKIAPM